MIVSKQDLVAIFKGTNGVDSSYKTEVVLPLLKRKQLPVSRGSSCLEECLSEASCY